MSFDSPIVSFLLYVAIFLGVLLAFDGFRQFLSREETEKEAKNRRMRMVSKGATAEEVLNLLTESRRQRNRSLMQRLRALLLKAGFTLSPPVFIAITAALTLPVFVGLLNVLPAPVAAVLAFGLVFSGALYFLSAKSRSRTDKMVQQLPDALDLMSRGLTVGHPLSVTVQTVATDMPDPIGTEFGIVQDQVSYGDDVVTAFNDLAERVDSEDARYLAVSVSIQHGTGGNLARVLEVLSKVIRDRATMKRRIKAISSEGRLSAFILSMLPFFIFGSVNVLTPSFYGAVWDDPMFLPFAVAILSLIGLQAAILYKLVNFKF